MKNPVEGAMHSNESLQRWVYDAHHDVNVRNQKTSPPFEEVVRRFGVIGPSEYGHTRVSLADPLFEPNLLETERGTMAGARAADERNVLIGTIIALVACIVIFTAWTHHKSRRTQKLAT
jgi:hypothetical protein